MGKYVLQFAAAVALFAATSVSNAAPIDLGPGVRFPVERHKLPNGLTVLLHEDHSAPIVSYQTWFRVGSKDERPGLTGIAHLFEHMMFKGAKRYSGDQFDKLLQSNGAQNNAGTSHDFTYYYENFPPSALELIIDIESDRMDGLGISDDALKSERDVVKEERRFRVDNSPMGSLREAIFGTVFRVSSYRWPVIGYMADLDNVNKENALAFYRTFYAPNNAIVVVAGDFKSADALRMIQARYGKIASQTIPARVKSVEPAQTSVREQSLTKTLEAAIMANAFQAAPDGSDEAFALDLAANVLGRGPSSRLHRRLVYKEQIASSVNVSNETLQDSGVFQAVVSMKPGARIDRAQKAVTGEIWKLRNWLIAPNELEAARTSALKSYVDALKTVSGRAEALGFVEAVHGDYEKLFETWDRYRKVTAEDVRKASRKYLDPSKASAVVLRPLKALQPARPAKKGSDQ